MAGRAAGEARQPRVACQALPDPEGARMASRPADGLCDMHADQRTHFLLQDHHPLPV